MRSIKSFGMVSLPVFMAMFVLLVLCLGLKGMVGRATENVVYVAPVGNCGGSQPCFAEIQEAVDAANPGDEIRVAAGVYDTLDMRPRLDITTTGYVTQVVYITKTIFLRGGYTPANWETADPQANVTHVDAQGKGRGIYVSGPISPTITGFHISDGDPTGLGGEAWMPDDVGGGIYAIRAWLALEDNWIDGNIGGRGAGLYGIQGSFEMRDNTISNNTAPLGAGMFFIDSTVDLAGNRLIGNHGGQGGGMFMFQCKGQVQENLFQDNDGSGLGISWGNDTILVRGNTLKGNSREGIEINGTNVTIEDNLITSNQTGGVDFCCWTNATVSNNTILANTGGSGLMIGNSNATLINNLIADNQAESTGSGLVLSASSVVAKQTTLAHNLGGGGTGIFVYGWENSPSSLQLINTILVGHTLGISVTHDATATLNGTLWGSGVWANGKDWQNAGTIDTGTVNLWSDPDFLNPFAGNYHIGKKSTAINRGVETGITFDIDHDPRYLQPDIGADEFVLKMFLTTVLRTK